MPVCCSEGSEGHVYNGCLPYKIDHVDAGTVPAIQTKIMLIVGDPSQAFHLAAIPNQGVGLARIEFIVSNHIGIHPMALAQFPNLWDLKQLNDIPNRIAEEDPKEFFIRRLSEGVAQIAAAFYPKPVIVRTSDFKTNEYARLFGGAEFEPKEENPMIGFRGASRYYDPRYCRVELSDLPVMSIGFAFATTKWQIILLFVIYGVFYSIDEAQSKAFIADVEPERRATAIGVYNFVTGVIYLPASLIAGAMWAAHPAIVFVLAAFLSLVAINAFVLLRPARQ